MSPQRSYNCISICAALDIERCDLNIKENSSRHHTDLFGEERLIVRRGQPFTIVLHVKPDGSEFRLDDTSFSLVAETGKPLLNCNRLLLGVIFFLCSQLPHMRAVLDSTYNLISVSEGPLPRKESGTKVVFALHESTADTQWSASAAQGPSENTVLLSISSSPNAPIGLYALTLDQEGRKIPLGEFVLLFNAWFPGELDSFIGSFAPRAASLSVKIHEHIVAVEFESVKREAAPSVCPGSQEMPSTCTVRARGRSMFWRNMGRSTEEPINESKGRPGTLDRCTPHSSQLGNKNRAIYHLCSGIFIYVHLQFDPDILDICFMILDANPKYVSDADKDCSARRNPIYVTRVLSAMVGP